MDAYRMDMYSVPWNFDFFSNARICVNCKGLYCVDCYTIRKKCLDCTFPLQIIAENVEFYVDSSCSDEDDT